jgi:hypothetical protein
MTYGLKCPYHGQRHMVRTGTQEYTCSESGEVFSLKDCIGAAKSASTAPLPAPPMRGRDLTGKELAQNHLEVYGREYMGKMLNIFGPKETKWTP